MAVYAGYVALVMLIEDFSIPWVFVLLTPFLKVKFGNLEAMAVWLTSVYCIVFDQPFLQSALSLLSLLIMLRKISGAVPAPGKEAVKTYLQ